MEMVTILQKSHINSEEHVFNCAKMVLNDYKCDICGFQCALRINLHDHSVRVHNHAEIRNNVIDIVKKWNCEKCNFQTYSFLVLYEHHCKPWELKMETKAENSNSTPYVCANIYKLLYKCKICDFGTNLKILLESHVNEVHNDQALCDSASQKSYSCEKCNFQTCSVLVFDKHVCTLATSIRNEKPKKRFQCEHCKFGSNRETSFQRHLKLTHQIGEVSYPCTQCEHTFAHRIDLDRHISKEQCPKKHQCPHCDFKTRFYYPLKMHIFLRHKNYQKVRYKCEDCHITFKLNVDLERHLLEAHSNKAKKLEHSLHSDHKKKSKEQYKYQCDHCVFFTKDLSCMRRHLFTLHSNNTDTHQRDRCDFKTVKLMPSLIKRLEHKHSARLLELRRLASSLKEHMSKRRADNKIIKCGYCEKRFKKWEFRTHVFKECAKKAENEIAKSFHCQLCDYKAPLLATLKSHISSVHTCYRCENCETTFKLKEHLLGHLLEVHLKEAEKLVPRDQCEDKIP